MSSINNQLLELARDELLDELEHINTEIYELIKSIEQLNEQIKLNGIDD